MYEFYFWFIRTPIRSLWLRWKFRNETPEQTALRRQEQAVKIRELWSAVLEQFKDVPDDREMIESRQWVEQCIAAIWPVEEKAQNVVDKS